MRCARRFRRHSRGADLGDVAAATALAEAVLSRFGRLDALVVSRRAVRATPVGAASTGRHGELIDSNLKGAAVPPQSAPATHSRGCIVNITDIHAERRSPAIPYVAAGPVIRLSRRWQWNWAPRYGSMPWPPRRRLARRRQLRCRRPRAAVVRSDPAGCAGHSADISAHGALPRLRRAYVTGPGDPGRRTL